ncbi:hypothetical protein CL6EHI_040820 [Entamoeba histolytica]|uniref:Uncharacterized protein n=1 Tax=Entamoeba histolytica TaxID=5759 RepID=A0A175K0D9_ENTHI|nr:hypothetical protein CL6EHI_040820 [Entamoeba histolytica]
MGITIGIAFVLSFCLVGALYFIFPKLIKHWLFWYIFSMIIFVFSVGGLVYNVMHQPSSFGFDRSHNIIYFSPDARGQFYMEGYIGSFLYASVGIGLVLFFELGRKSVVTLAVVFAFLVLVLSLFNNAIHTKISWVNISFNILEAYVNAFKDLLSFFNH